ncbi:MAG: hypothetical protein PHZ07_05290, partial [Patescibacteria group bacterium]|nr:hypothetical protein [Patescibacteria group bacterium]MDD4304825.1 hypothetical protein [Patescibacteria group bacterium]
MKYNGSEWENVGSAGFSAGTVITPTLAIDSSGTPYVAYRDVENSSKATVMKYNGSSWENVGSAGFSAGTVIDTSLAIDSSGTPYVAYGDGGNSDKATVMKYNGSEWENVGSAGFSAGTANYTSLVFPSASTTPYVAYSDGGNSNKATVMKYNGSSWENVGSAGFSAGTANYTSLAIDSSGTPYVAYGDGGNSDKATVMKYTSETLWEPTSYEVDSIQDLYNIKNDSFGIYSLTKDLDFNDIDNYDQSVPDGYSSVDEFKTAMTTGTGWIPICETGDHCSVQLNGNLHKILNLYINTGESYSLGLFGRSNGRSNFTNIGLENINITSTYDDYAWGIGGLAGANYLGTITNSYTTGV